MWPHYKQVSLRLNFESWPNSQRKEVMNQSPTIIALLEARLIIGGRLEQNSALRLNLSELLFLDHSKDPARTTTMMAKKNELKMLAN